MLYILPINIHQTQRFLLILSANIKKSWGLRLHTPSYILSAYIQLLPLIYLFYQHSLDPKISPQFSANVKNFPGVFAPRPPHISFLFTFNMPTLSYLPHISFLLTFNFSPFYILPINIHQTPRFLLITAQISKIFLGASPPDPSYLLPVYIQLLPLIYPFYQYSPDPKISPHYRANIKNFLGGFAPRVQTTSDILPAYIQLCPQTPS